MKNVLATLQKVENFIMATTFIVMTLSCFGQVVNRNLIGAGIPWFEELARYCMVYMTLLGTEVGLRDGSQIAVTAVVDKFPRVPKLVVAFLGKLVIVAFSAIVFYTSFTILEKQWRYPQLSSGLGIPMYTVYFALPLSFGLITLVQAASAILMLVPSDKKNDGAVEGGAA